MRYSVVSSPIGDIVISGHELVSGVDFADSRGAPHVAANWERDDGAFPEVTRQLRAYFAGELTRFELDLDTGGTPFQQRVWSALQRIPYGTTTTYGKIAAELGEPRAVRAVGAANGRNPISIIIPCHRLVGSDGNLTGYGGGLPRKQWLIAHERGEAPPAW